MPNVKDLALPILYLQRHTFELLVKGLLASAIDERRILHELDELFGTTLGHGPATPSDFELAHTTHELSKLVPRLVANLAALDRSPLPPEFEQLQKLFVDVDKDRPDKLRYATQFNRSKGTTSRSFPGVWERQGRKFAPCDEVGALAKLLETRKVALDAIVNDELSPDSELGRFFFREYEASQAVVDGAVRSRLGPITRATRDGDIHWTDVPPEQVRFDEHPVLADMAKDVGGGLETTFNGRCFMLVWLRGVVQVSGSDGKRREDDFFLAARRSNGTLTAGVWPQDGQSDLAYEAIRAYRRDRGIDETTK
jgi:hypothetical protein